MAHIEIKSVQNVRIRYELATFWERFLATIIDWFVILILYLVYFFFLNFWNLDYRVEQNAIAIGAGLLIFFYSPVSEYFFRGSSLGKRTLGLRILRLDGRPCEISDYIIRWVFRSVDIFGSIGSVVALMVGFSSTRQRIGDLLANTVVVKSHLKESSIQNLLSIRSLATYSPRFLASSVLLEADAILIKEVLDRNRTSPGPGSKKAKAEMTRFISEKIGVPNSVAEGDPEFLITVLRDYIAITR
jgi:uncharacterized RDD family membrane protein YckC